MKKTILALSLAAIGAAAFATTPQTAPAPTATPAPAATAGAPMPTGIPAVITREQFMKRAADQFEAMDTNHDGKLTSDEMQAFFNKVRPGGMGGPGGHGGPGQGPAGGPPPAQK